MNTKNSAGAVAGLVARVSAYRGGAACPNVRKRRGEPGMALLEVLVAATFLGIAAVGIAMMFARGLAFTVGEGDDRVAIYLAQQKIESLKAMTFACIPIGGPGMGDQTFGPNSSCAATATAIYNELQVAGFPGSCPVQPTTCRYSRSTVVQCVDPNTLLPVTCPVAPALPDAKRIAVTVTPRMVEPRIITVESVLTIH